MQFNIWMFPILIPIAEAVDQYRDVDGFIIDLRENPGGIGGLAMGVAGHFLATDESLGDMKMRPAGIEVQEVIAGLPAERVLFEPHPGHHVRRIVGIASLMVAGDAGPGAPGGRWRGRQSVAGVLRLRFDSTCDTKRPHLCLRCVLIILVTPHYPNCAYAAF